MMPWYALISSETTKNHIIHAVKDGPAEKIYRYATVRGGVSYPNERAPGAYVVLGLELDDELEVLPSRLFLLDEGEVSGLSIDSFWDTVTDAVSLFRVLPLYLDTKDEGHMAAFYDYLDRRKITIDFQAAPFSDSFFVGLATCTDWFKDGKLELHKDSKTRAQLKSITRQDVNDDPAIKFPLVNALRHALSGFRKFQVTQPLVLKIPKGNINDWML